MRRYRSKVPGRYSLRTADMCLSDSLQACRDLNKSDASAM